MHKSFVLLNSVLDLSKGWGVYPPGASQPPSLYWPPKKIVKISQKYIADPLWFSHKSSTGWTTANCLQYNTQLLPSNLTGWHGLDHIPDIVIVWVIDWNNKDLPDWFDIVFHHQS